MFNNFIQTKKNKLVVLITMALLSGSMISGCQLLEPQDSTVNNSDKIVKKNAEVMMCTMHYDPVCATVEVGGKKTKKQFSNTCAMSNFRDGNIISSNQGTCQ